MLSKLEKDFVHLEGSRDRLDKHSSSDCTASHADVILRKAEDIVPKASLEVVLHLWQVEVRSMTALDLLDSVVEEEHAEVEERAGHILPIDLDVRLLEMPASCTDKQNGGLVAQLVLLARLCVLEVDLSADGIIQVRLSVKAVCPCWRI